MMPLAPVPQQSQQQRRAGTGMQGFEELNKHEESNYNRFFVDGIEAKTPSKRRQIVGRILPAFNSAFTLGTPEFMRSVIPYRLTDNTMDVDRNVPMLSNWAKGFAGYKRWGDRIKADILSPKTLGVYGRATSPEDLRDPIEDLRKAARNIPQFAHLTQSASADVPPKLPKVQKFGVFNYFGMEVPIQNGQAQNSQYPPANFLAYTKLAGFDELVNRLAYPTVYGTEPYDKNWANFLYGDVTDPQNGLMCWSVLANVGTITVHTFAFSHASNSLQGAQKYPVGTDVLERRIVIDAPIFNFLTYQQIVDMIVEDGSIPHELVVHACQYAADIPAPKRQASHSFPAATPPGFAPQPGQFPQAGGMPGQFPGMAPQGFPQQQPQGGQFPAMGAPAGALPFPVQYNQAGGAPVMAQNQQVPSMPTAQEDYFQGLPQPGAAPAAPTGGFPAMPMVGGPSPASGNFGMPGMAPSAPAAPAMGGFPGMGAPAMPAAPQAFQQPTAAFPQQPQNPAVVQQPATPPPLPVPQAQPTTPPPAPVAAPEAKVWISLNGQAPKEVGESEAKALAQQTGNTVQAHISGAWKTAAELGWTAPAVQPLPQQPTQPAAPTLPAPAPVAQQQQPQAQQPSGGNGAQPLSDAELARYREIHAAMAAPGAPQPDPSVITEFLGLDTRAKAAGQGIAG